MAKRRGNGEGSVSYHKASGRYIAQYTKPNGKRGAVYGKTPTEARNKLKKILSEIQMHTYTEKNNITLIQLATAVVEDKFKTNRINENTYRTNIDTLKRIMIDEIANKPIQKITTEQMKEYFFRMVNKYKYSNTLIHKNYGLINAAFKRAVAKGYIRINLLDDKEELAKPKSKIKDKKICAFTLEEQNKLMEAISSYKNVTYKNIILLALYTGMRSGEILALKIDNIDFINKVIHIERTLSRNKEAKTIIGDNTKTKNSSRDIAITPIVEQILKDCRANFVFNNEKLLFCSNKNGIITNSMINSAFKRFCQKHNIGKKFDVNFHMLRHTYATRCIESGMQAKVLSKKLGHTKISITLDTYTDVFAKMEDKFDEQFMDYLKEHKIAL